MLSLIHNLFKRSNLITPESIKFQFFLRWQNGIPEIQGANRRVGTIDRHVEDLKRAGDATAASISGKKTKI